MSRMKWVVILSVVLMAAIVTVAGFFYDEPKAPMGAGTVNAAHAAPAQMDNLSEREAGGRWMRKLAGAAQASSEVQAGSVPSYGTEGKAYQRDAMLSVRVSDVFDTLAKVEKMVADAKGYVESEDVSGNTTSHDGRLRVAVPSDRFTEVFGAFRKMGDLQTERITSQMVGPVLAVGSEPSSAARTELVHVDLTLSDNPERLAQTRIGAVMSTAWSQGMEHFSKGGAVLLEGLGYVLPFILAFTGILVLVGTIGFVGRVARRITAPRIPCAVPVEQ